jgi:FkbM family methyltransferase
MAWLLRIFGHAEWIRLGVRSRIISFFHNPNKPINKNFIVSFYGHKYAGCFDTYIDWSVFYYGAYARQELRLIEHLLRQIKDPVFLDVGANIGHHTVFASTLAQKVYSFEPYPAVFNKLKEKIEINNLNNVVLLEFALGDSNAELEYSIPLGANTGTGSFLFHEGKGEKRVLFQVKVGDEVIKSLDLAKVNFIKIDTEGFESLVLQGLKHTLSTFRPFVFFEWTTSRADSFLSAQDMLPENYSVFQFMPYVHFMKFFCMRDYRLAPLKVDQFLPEGMILAVPDESKILLWKRRL